MQPNFSGLSLPALCAQMAVVLAAQPAFAHHGFAVHYDVADQVRLEGTIDRVLLKNPHSTEYR